MKTTTYTIHRGTVRSSATIAAHRLGIYERQDRARFNVSALDKRSTERRAAEAELKTSTARADEASKMHLITFVPPYVPTKASRVYPSLKTCTSPRRAFAWQVKTGRIRHDPTIVAMYATPTC